MNVFCFLGAILIINRHRFKITSADMYDYNYMREHPELFSVEAINGVYNYLVENNLIPVNEVKDTIASRLKIIINVNDFSL